MPKKSIFNIHDPTGVKRLFQLRVGLSPLRHHKKKYNFRDTPTDICRCKASAGTTVHFLIRCELYAEVRNTMFKEIRPLLYVLDMQNDNMLVKFLLYGNDTLSIEENKAVLSATLKFIHQSNRFKHADE